jgi:F-type H+-transporting ATPase subunit epsilon
LTASGFQVEIVSPERPLFRGAADAVVAESHDGEVGILPGHAPMVALLGTGIVRVRTTAGGSKGEGFAIRGGFLQVLAGKVTLLVTQAARREDVDPAKAKAALAKAIEALAHPKSDEEFARLLDERRWWETQLQLSAS